MKKSFKVFLWTLFTFYLMEGVIINLHYYIAHCECAICTGFDRYIELALKWTEVYLKGIGIILFIIPLAGIFAVSLVIKQQ